MYIIIIYLLGTLSNGNFTIPSLFGFEETVGLSKEFDEIEENNMKPEIHKLKPEIRDWHVIDVAKPTNRVSSFMSTQSNREDGLLFILLIYNISILLISTIY